MTDVMRDIFGGAVLLVVLVLSITGLIFPRRLQAIAIDFAVMTNIQWRIQLVRSNQYLWSLRLGGAIGMLGCLFVLWMIIKNCFHLGH